MPANVEIKARVHDPQTLLARARKLAGTDPVVLHQQDTFFTVPAGRLKLRDFGDGSGELIRYRRPDTAGPKVSDYSLTPTADPGGLADVLTRALGTIGKVTKTRTLLLAGRTRIHIDDVEGLGWFMELEVVLDGNESAAEGEKETHRLMSDLGIRQEDLVTGAYLDLLEARAGTSTD